MVDYHGYDFFYSLHGTNCLYDNVKNIDLLRSQ